MTGLIMDEVVSANARKTFALRIAAMLIVVGTGVALVSPTRAHTIGITMPGNGGAVTEMTPFVVMGATTLLDPNFGPKSSNHPEFVVLDVENTKTGLIAYRCNSKDARGESLKWVRDPGNPDVGVFFKEGLTLPAGAYTIRATSYVTEGNVSKRISYSVNISVSPFTGWGNP